MVMSHLVNSINRFFERATRYDQIQAEIRRRVDKTILDHISASMTLLNDARMTILDEIASAAPESFNAFIYPQIQAALEDAIVRWQAQQIEELNAAKTDAAEVGSWSVEELAALNDPNMVLPAISTDFLNTALMFSADQVKNLSSDMLTRLNVILQQAVLTGDTPFNVMGQVRSFLSTPEVPRLEKGPMAGERGIAFRAETIVRTEGMRMATTAQWEGMKAANDVMAMDKIWQTARDARVRDSHQMMEGVTIPMEEDFEVGPGKEKAYGPYDPRLSPRERINCRCILTFKPHSEV